MWLLHRTSSFDCVVGPQDMERVCEVVCGMFGSRHHAPHVTIAVLWLLCLSHAEQLDKAEFRSVSVDAMPEGVTFAQKCNLYGGQCAFLRKGILRCMHGITESISLPGLLKWLPYMITFSSTSDDESYRNSLSNGVSPMKFTPQSMSSCTLSITIKERFNSTGNNWCSLLSTMMGAAVVELAALSPSLTDDSGQEISSHIKKNMTLCIRNLLFAPFTLIQKSCHGLRFLLDGTQVRGNQVHSTGARGVDMWKQMFAVWLLLEEKNIETVAQCFSLLGDACICAHGVKASALSHADFAGDMDVMLSMLLCVLDCMRRELRPNGGVTTEMGVTTSRQLRLCEDAVVGMLTTTVLFWWIRVNDLCIALMHMQAVSSEKQHGKKEEVLAALTQALSNPVVSPLLDAISRAKTTMQFPLVRVSCVENALSFSVPSASATPVPMRAELNELLAGNALSICHSLVFDVCLKVVLLSRCCSVDDSNHLEYPHFVNDVILHLTAFKGMTDNGDSHEEYRESVTQFVKRCFPLVDEDASLQLMLKTFWAEWHADPNSSSGALDHSKTNKTSFLGPEKQCFEAMESDISSQAPSLTNTLVRETTAPPTLLPTSTPGTKKKEPFTVVKRSYASLSTSNCANPAVQSSIVATSPYSPVINIRVGHPKDTHAEISSVLGKRREQEQDRHERVKLSSAPVISSHGKVLKSRQWDVVPTYSNCDRALLTAQSQQPCSYSFQEIDMGDPTNLPDITGIARVVKGRESGTHATGRLNGEEERSNGEESERECTEVDFNGDDGHTAVDEDTLVDTSIMNSVVKSVPEGSTGVKGLNGEDNKRAVARVPFESDETLTGVTLLSGTAVGNGVDCNHRAGGGKGSVLMASTVANDGLIEQADGDENVEGLTCVLTYIAHSNGILSDLIEGLPGTTLCEGSVLDKNGDSRLTQLDEAAWACHDLMGRILQYRRSLQADGRSPP